MLSMHGERVEASAVIGGSSTAVIETVNSAKDLLCLHDALTITGSMQPQLTKPKTYKNAARFPWGVWGLGGLGVTRNNPRCLHANKQEVLM
jgi:hypothetical protein